MSVFDEPLPPSPPSATDRANRWLEVGRYDLAERELRRALAEEPQNARLHCQLGWALEGLGRKAEAEAVARTALGLAPEDFAALTLVGHLAATDGRHREAEEMYLTALRLDPTHPRLLDCYATLMFKTGYLDKAERLIRTSLQSDPDSSRAHGILSLILTEKEKGSKAAHAHARRGLELEPEAEFSHTALGVSALHVGRPFLARHHFREALRLEPSSSAEVGFYEADLCCRWTQLPFYFWSRLLERLPGRQYTVWGVFVASMLVLPRLDISPQIPGSIALGYLVFCIYTWIAVPITKLWVRLVPPRL